ncbi:hypothetical protein RJ527_11205 [Thalassospiraceae bacterium LMO-SO8]|nr:hypothetical protein [Alphaproteobacteria bacterium LMO-S08]WND74607.1 hypothetical protein RJ527_11205 [Thalassospiraceae bacterium LMO-SO8]
MSSGYLTRAEGLFRILPAVLLIAGGLSLFAPAAAAEEFATVRMRPQAMPFVTPDNKIVKRIVNFFMTVTKEAVREVCANQAEVKSIFLVNTYNRQLADAKWQYDMMNLASDLYRALEPMFGREKLVAVHLSLGRTESSRPTNQIQKRLEQLEDCTTVRSLPGDAVTARYSDAMAAPVRSLATDASKATAPDAAKTSAASAEDTDKPFETHPQMRAAPEPEIDLTKTEIKAPPPKGKPGACNFEISDLWQPAWVELDKERFRFARAFTVDADANGRVDDVSFVLKREDDSELTTTYLSLHSTRGNAEIRHLTLADPLMIFRLCPGSHDFPMPGAVMKEAAKIERPDLAAEVMARIKGEVPPPVAEPDAVDFWRWVAAVVAITAVVLAVAVLLVFYLMMRSDRRRKRDRRKKRRRKGDRRRRDDGPKGAERRKGGDRREDEDRREEGPRRKQTDRRGTTADD